jgi:ATP:corrinoid adenosyltransferase
MAGLQNAYLRVKCRIRMMSIDETKVKARLHKIKMDRIVDKIKNKPLEANWIFRNKLLLDRIS